MNLCSPLLLELAAAPVEVLKTAPVEAVAPTGEPVELAQVVEPPPAVPPWLPQHNLRLIPCRKPPAHCP